MGCIWAGRWKQYFKIKKEIYEWHKQGFSRQDIENKLRRKLEGVELRVVNG
tara:strand:- start:3093 stop:3245 length:153 start_codon:yes stop_codon:yes gene_type:complete